MTFLASKLYIDRGKVNDSVSPGALAQHSYQNLDDTLAVITAANYFPDYLGQSPESVKVNDNILIRGSDDIQTYKITAGSPMTLVAETPGGGNVDGAASSTDDALAKYDGTTGKLIQNSNATLSDAGDMTLAGGIFLPTSGGTATSLDYFEQGTFATSFSGPSATTQTPTVHFLRIGDVVHLSIAFFGSDGVATSSTYFRDETGSIPARLRHATSNDVYQVINVQHNSVALDGRLRIDNTGDIYIGMGPLWSDPFPIGEVAVVPIINVSYSLNN